MARHCHGLNEAGFMHEVHYYHAQPRSKHLVPIRVLLVDDTKMVRNAIESFLECDPEIQIVGEAASLAPGSEALELKHE
jgi:hypothetical protein